MYGTPYCGTRYEHFVSYLHTGSSVIIRHSVSLYKFLGKLLHHRYFCPLCKNAQRLSIEECIHFLYQPIRELIYNITLTICTLLLYHPFLRFRACHLHILRITLYPVMYMTTTSQSFLILHLCFVSRFFYQLNNNYSRIINSILPLLPPLYPVMYMTTTSQSFLMLHLCFVSRFFSQLNDYSLIINSVLPLLPPLSIGLGHHFLQGYFFS